RAFPVTAAQGVGRVALESTSPPFQSGAIPSQLPARKWPRPGACDTGPWSAPDQEDPVPSVSVASNLGDGDRSPGWRNSALAPYRMDLETSRRTWRLTPTSREDGRETHQGIPAWFS